MLTFFALEKAVYEVSYERRGTAGSGTQMMQLAEAWRGRAVDGFLAAYRDKPINRSQQVLFRHMSFERELVEQRVLLDFPLPHHRLPPSHRDLRKSRDYTQ